MAADYRNYKTPYYEITIYSPDFSKEAKLPEHILKLVQSIEIQESFVSGLLNTGGNTFKMSILEGSREPASPNASLGTQGLFNLKDSSGSVDTDISGSITNRTGSIVDLRFSGSSGITFITSKEKTTNTIENSTVTNIVGKETSRKYKKESKAPKYLFEFMNKIKITWGYRENWDASKRTMIFSMMQIETIFADSGPNIVNISGTDYGVALHKISPENKGRVFGEVVTTKNGDLINFSDLKTDEMLRRICKNSGWDFLISTGLPSDTYDRNKQKIWISGQSFHEFLSKLAKLNNSYYQLINNPQNNKTTLIFIKKTEFEAKSPIKDPSILVYKSPGSLIRHVTVNIDFSGLVASAISNTDSDGNTVQQSTDVTTQALFKGEKQINGDPTIDPSMKALVDSIAGGSFVSKKEITPVENKGFQKDLADTHLGDNSRLVEITVDMIGYPRLTPGVVTVGGLGVRYSGKYRILSVEHRIDENGYDTKFTGTTFSLPTGEELPPDPEKGTEDPLVDQSLFSPHKEETTNRDALNAILGI